MRIEIPTPRLMPNWQEVSVWVGEPGQRNREAKTPAPENKISVAVAGTCSGLQALQ